MEDENNLICSPTESECSNGPLYNDQDAQGPRIGGEFEGNNGNTEDFLPKPKHGPLNQVVASLRGQDAKTGRSYGPLGSCPNLTQTSGPLLNRPCIIEDR
ncbi:uncharacterized protein LOC111702690 isoform X2 [Eurytemora carolleeae]|nr:uncharacterized protein LOC111702690 isoform X2 [Eurytemora carolleeae]|eukprot:XP_023330225.1 uncharacterized protein LOC111702690 isoform X2 [Eurytemora affinis]